MNDQNDEQIALLKEIARWVRFNGFSQVKGILQTTLDNDKKRLVYHLSDGKNTSRTIAQKSGTSQPRIVELWKDWLALGLGESIKITGGHRFKHSFDLKIFRIAVPVVQTELNETLRQAAEPTNEK